VLSSEQPLLSLAAQPCAGPRWTRSSPARNYECAAMRHRMLSPLPDTPILVSAMPRCHRWLQGRSSATPSGVLLPPPTCGTKWPESPLTAAGAIG